MLSPVVKKMPCDNELLMLIGKSKICISKKPLIQLSEVEYVSDIQYDPTLKKHYVDIGLSSAAVQTLNRGFASLPNNRYAFVMKDEVICVVKVESEITVRFFRMGYDLSLKDLTEVHKVLKTLKP